MTATALSPSQRSSIAWANSSNEVPAGGRRGRAGMGSRPSEPPGGYMAFSHLRQVAPAQLQHDCARQTLSGRPASWREGTAMARPRRDTKVEGYGEGKLGEGRGKSGGPG